MRTWLGTILLVALAVGLALVLRDHSGNVFIVAQPWRIELSLAFAVFLLIAAFIVFYCILRLLAWLLSRPERFRSWKLRRSEKKDLEQLQHGWISVLEGRFTDVENDLGKLLGRTRSSQTKVLAALALARAHQQLAEYPRRDEALGVALAAANTARLKEAAQVVQAEMYLEQNRAQDALAILAPFENSGSRHTTATRLLLHAHHQLKQYDQVYSLTRALQRRKVIGPEQAAPLIEAATIARLKSAGIEGFRAIWSDLKPDEKTAPKVAFAAATVQDAAGNHDDARKILEAALNKQLDVHLLNLYAHCPPEQVAPRLSKAEGWLKSNPDNPDLLIALGSLCLIGQLWGPGERYLQRSKTIRSDVRVHALLGNLYDKLGRKDDAFRHWQLASSGAGALPTFELGKLLPAADMAGDPLFFHNDDADGLSAGRVSAPAVAASAADYFADDALETSRPPALASQVPVPESTDSHFDDYFDSAPPSGIDFTSDTGSQSSDNSRSN